MSIAFTSLYVLAGACRPVEKVVSTVLFDFDRKTWTYGAFNEIEFFVFGELLSLLRTE